MPRRYQPFHVPSSIDPLVSEPLKRINDWLKEADIGFSRIDRGLRPSGNSGSIADKPGTVDHGNLSGLVPVISGTTVTDYNDDHTQYPLIYGRPDGQYIYGSRDADLLETFAGKGNLILAANYDAGGTTTSWTGMTADGSSLVGEGCIVVLATRDGVATTGATNQHSALADSKSNSWTKLEEFTAQLSTVYYTVSIWTTTVTSAHVASSTTFTATFTSAVTWMAMEGYRFSLGVGLSFEKSDSTTGSQSGGNPSAIVRAASTGRALYLRASVLEAISGDPASIGWTPTSGFSDFTDDDDHTDSSATGGTKNVQARAEWVVKTDEGVTSDPDALPVSPSETWRDASILMAIQVGVSGTGSLTLRSKDASLAASFYLTGSTIKVNADFFQWRAPGGTTTLSYIDGSDGTFYGPVAASALSLDSMARGDLLVGNATPTFVSLPIGSADTVLYSDGTDPSWTAITTAMDGFLRLDLGNTDQTGNCVNVGTGVDGIAGEGINLYGQFNLSTTYASEILSTTKHDLTLENTDTPATYTYGTSPPISFIAQLGLGSAYGTVRGYAFTGGAFPTGWQRPSDDETIASFWGLFLNGNQSGRTPGDGGMIWAGRYDDNLSVRGEHDAIFLKAVNADGGGYLGRVYASDLVPLDTATYNLGAPDKKWSTVYLIDAPMTGQPLSQNTAGMLWDNTTIGTAYVGMDNIFPEFYSQRTAKYGSSVTDNTEDATNLYQGNWGNGATPYWPFLEICFNAGDGSVGNFTNGTAEHVTYIRDSAVTVGFYNNAGYGAGGLYISSNYVAAGLYIYGEQSNKEIVFRTLNNTAKAVAYVENITFAGSKLISVRPETDDYVDLGGATNRWKDLYLSGGITLPTSSNAYTPTNVSTDRSYDANATSIDELADVLGTLIADLQTAGIIG